MPGEDDKENGIYGIVFFITIALFLFIGYQGYQRYIRKPNARPMMLSPDRAPVSEVPDDGYDRAPSSLPVLRVDGGVVGGAKTQ